MAAMTMDVVYPQSPAQSSTMLLHFLIVLHIFAPATYSLSYMYNSVLYHDMNNCNCTEREQGRYEVVNCTFQFSGYIGVDDGSEHQLPITDFSPDTNETCCENGEADDCEDIDIEGVVFSGGNLCSGYQPSQFKFAATRNNGITEVTITFCEIMSEHYLYNGNYCIRNARRNNDVCPSTVTVDAAVTSTSGSVTSSVSTTIEIYGTYSPRSPIGDVSPTEAYGTAQISKKLIAGAAVSAVVVVIIFIIAVILVVICCRRTKRRSKESAGSLTPTGMEPNAAYISVETAPANPGLPVYAKPNKGNRQPNATGDDGGYEKAPAIRPPESGYEDATLSPIPRFSGNYESDPPATPPRPRSHHMARTSTPADGYEGANFKTPRGDSADGYEEATLPGGTGDNFKTPNPGYSTGYENNFVTPATGLTTSSSGYEDNFVTPKGGVSDGYEDNFVTPQTGTKESVKYDHLKRKLDLDDDTGSGAGNLDVKEADGYGQIRKQSELVDAEEYQHLSHDKAPSNVEDGYGMLKKK